MVQSYIYTFMDYIYFFNRLAELSQGNVLCNMAFALLGVSTYSTGPRSPPEQRVMLQPLSLTHKSLGYKRLTETPVRNNKTFLLGIETER